MTGSCASTGAWDPCPGARAGRREARTDPAVGRPRLRFVAAALALHAAAGAAAPVFGGREDTAFAARLWRAMAEARLVGPDARTVRPVYGKALPHGWVLEIQHRPLQVEGRTGYVVVKKNYGGGEPTIAEVEADRAHHLHSITVMYRRKAGYDPENLDWFWAKYRGGGSLFTKATGAGPRPVAGRVAKGPSGGESGGCIWCHRSAADGDYLFYPEIRLPGWEYSER